MKSDCLRAIAEDSIDLSSQNSLDYSSRYSNANLLVHAAPHPSCRICIIVPVRNEARSLVSTLTALANQINLQGKPFDPNSYEVIVLANNCSDDSAAIARRFAQQHPAFALHVAERALSPSDAYIGRVRQLLMDEAYHRLMFLGQRRGIIASTDGDTKVAPNWIAAIQHEIELGADGVSGRIMTEPAERARLDPYTRACYLRAIGYGYLCVELEAHVDPDPFDRLPRHHQHCGASLAVTAEIYAKAGGMPPVRTPEDVAFYRSLVRVGARFRHSPLVWVETSARHQGRTCNGMANQLSEWSTMGQRQQAYLVEPALAVETRFWSRRHLRDVWQRYRQKDEKVLKQMYLVAKQLCVDPDWLNRELRRSHSFNALFEQVELRQVEDELWQQHWLQVPIEQAMHDLRTRISSLRQRSTNRV